MRSLFPLPCKFLQSSMLQQISAQGEELGEFITKVQHEVKEALEISTLKYKEHANKKRREIHFKVGDKVWAYLRKERLPKGRYSKLQMKKVGPCNILNKMGENAYEISLPPTFKISPVFNVTDLTPYKGIEDSTSEQGEKEEINDENYVADLPQRKPMESEEILDTNFLKQTRTKKYMQYLVKWKGLPNIDATWMTEHQIKQHGNSM